MLTRTELVRVVLGCSRVGGGEAKWSAGLRGCSSAWFFVPSLDSRAANTIFRKKKLRMEFLKTHLQRQSQQFKLSKHIQDLNSKFTIHSEGVIWLLHVVSRISGFLLFASALSYNFSKCFAGRPKNVTCRFRFEYKRIMTCRCHQTFQIPSHPLLPQVSRQVLHGLHCHELLEAVRDGILVQFGLSSV